MNKKIRLVLFFALCGSVCFMSCGDERKSYLLLHYYEDCIKSVCAKKIWGLYYKISAENEWLIVEKLSANALRASLKTSVFRDALIYYYGPLK